MHHLKLELTYSRTIDIYPTTKTNTIKETTRTTLQQVAKNIHID